MPRPQKCRRICFTPQYDSFYPENSQTDDTITLTLDEYEVIRLVDLEKKTHEQCSAQMDVSRTTVTEIYESARYKDYNLLMIISLMSGIIIIACNMAAQILNERIDPRMRISRQSEMQEVDNYE